jgi:ubiquinone/menaquinone biosynthesis C-methylase UbiE
MVGITLSDALLKAAASKSAAIKVKGSLHFMINDYHRTGFRDGSFTKAFGIESICYSENVRAFADEMHRVLRGNGMLAIADFFKKRAKLGGEESKKYRQWLDGWAMPDLLTPEEFKHQLTSAGFAPVEFFDTTALVRKSIDLIHEVSTRRLLEMIVDDGSASDFIRSHLVSGCRQKELFENGVITYGIITAIKPG